MTFSTKYAIFGTLSELKNWYAGSSNTAKTTLQGGKNDDPNRTHLHLYPFARPECYLYCYVHRLDNQTFLLREMVYGDSLPAHHSALCHVQLHELPKVTKGTHGAGLTASFQTCHTASPL